MPRIAAPDPNFSGQIGDVQFTGGVAETDDPGVLAYCARRGYTIGEPEQAPAETGEQESTVERPAKSARKAEWVDYAIARGYSRADAESLTLDDLQSLLDTDEE